MFSGKTSKFVDGIGSEINIDSYLAGLYYRYDKNSDNNMELEGKTLPVLVEEMNEHDENLVTGRLDNNSVVHFPGTADMIGNIYQVKLEECKGFYYLGKVEAHE